MVILDQYTRRIIGYAVHIGDCDGITYCRLFNKIIAPYPPPKYLSSDNDPLFLFHRWKANLRIVGIKEIKSIPGVPTSHPFVERVIGTTRRECLDKILFFNALDLQSKLNAFQSYYNETRVHSSLALKTPLAMAERHQNEEVIKKVISLGNYKWKSHCKGLFNLPIAA